jgi:hypothetical protein
LLAFKGRIHPDKKRRDVCATRDWSLAGQISCCGVNTSPFFHNAHPAAAGGALEEQVVRG